MNQNFIVSSEYEEEISQDASKTSNNLDSKRTISNGSNCKELDLLIQGEEYSLVNENVIRILYPLLSNSKNCYDKKTNSFILPNKFKKEDFENFLYYIDYLNSENPEEPSKGNDIDFIYLKRVIDISLFFNAVDIIDLIIKKEIQPRINKDSALSIIKCFYEMKSIDKVKKIFNEVINQCIVCTAKNIIYIINNKNEEISNVSRNIIEEIVQLYFTSFNSNKNEDTEDVLSLLMTTRGINKDIFELLENERKGALINFDINKNNQQKKTNPTKIWKIDMTEEFYQEEELMFDNLKLKLISYYDRDNDIFKLAFQLVDTRSNLIRENTEENDEDCEESENKSIVTEKHFDEEKKEENNFFISILSLMEIPEIHYKTKTNFNCIYSNMNSKVLIFQIEKFSNQFISSTDNDNALKFTLKIYLSRIYVFSAILDHITRNFYQYKSLSSINKLPKIVLSLILKNQSLNCQNQKDLLLAISNWLSNKGNSQVFSAIDLFKTINWRLINNETLIDFFMYSHQLFAYSKEFKSIIFTEFQRRFQCDYLSNTMNVSNTTLQPSLLSSNTFSELSVLDNNNNAQPQPEFTTFFLNKILLNCAKSSMSFSSYIETENDQEKEKMKNYTSPNENNNFFRNKNRIQNKSNSMILQSHNQINTGMYDNSNPLSPSSYLVKKEKSEDKIYQKAIISNNYQTNVTYKSHNSSALSSQANISNSNNVLHKKYIDKNILNKLLSNTRSTTPDFLLKSKQSAKKSSRLPSRGHSKSIESKNQCSTMRPDYLSNTRKANSLYPKYINGVSQSGFNSHLIMGKTTKCVKNSKEFYVPINKNANSVYYTNISARNELIKTESSLTQTKKSMNQENVKKAISGHGRSRSNH